MLNEKNVGLGEVRSVIRELFEYGKERKAEIGEGNVYDFSIGNPSVPAPKAVTDALRELVEDTDPVALHSYTSAQGDPGVRAAVAGSLNRRFGTSLSADCIYMTCGAAAGLTISLNALLNPGDEVAVFAPYFPEYRVFVEGAGGTFVPVACDEGTFQPDTGRLAEVLSPKTKAVILNSPNNPSGVVYGEDVIRDICALLEKKSAEYGNPIYVICDEPYRELVYDEGVEVPFIMNHYRHSLVCYSYSKCLSLPGERIGYVAVDNGMEEWRKVYAAVCGAGRALGFVCAPSLFQRLVERCVDVKVDVSVYRANRDLLVSALTGYGYSVVRPDGAFYLFVKALEPDAKAFSARARGYELLVVEGDDFGAPGYVRVSYCVDPDMIRRSLPAFKALAESYAQDK